jgi:hypothetical protein
VELARPLAAELAAAGFAAAQELGNGAVTEFLG